MCRLSLGSLCLLSPFPPPCLCPALPLTGRVHGHSLRRQLGRQLPTTTATATGGAGSQQHHTGHQLGLGGGPGGGEAGEASGGGVGGWGGGGRAGRLGKPGWNRGTGGQLGARHIPPSQALTALEASWASSTLTARTRRRGSEEGGSGETDLSRPCGQAGKRLSAPRVQRSSHSVFAPSGGRSGTNSDIVAA